MKNLLRIKYLKFFCILLIITLYIGCGGEETEPPPVVKPVKTITVSGFGEGEITFPATVEAGEKVLLSFRVSGRIIELPVKQGEEVKKGQLIARLDPKDYQIAVDQARAEYNKAQADFERYQLLYEKDAVPLADLDLRISQRDVAKARLEEAEKNLTYTYLNAPFTGNIGRRYVDNFMDVTANETIIDLNDITTVEVKIDVPESIISVIRSLKDKIDLKIFAEYETAPDKQYPLKLKEISNRADPLTQTFEATFGMPQPGDITLLPGMNALVRLKVTLKPNVKLDSRIIIPGIAVLGTDNGGSYVWVVKREDMTVHRTKVELGQMRGEDNVFIKKGLMGGELLVVAGMKYLQEGMKVQLWKPEY